MVLEEEEGEEGPLEVPDQVQDGILMANIVPALWENWLYYVVVLQQI